MRCLWELLGAHGIPSRRTLSDADADVCLNELTEATALGGGPEQLRGRSVLLAARNQLAAALALIELDGVARRLVLCPPGILEAHLPSIMEAAATDAIVTDGPVPTFIQCNVQSVECSPKLQPMLAGRSGNLKTEWVLLTSGTTASPKLVMHTLPTLSGAIIDGAQASSGVVWSTFYDIRRYGGLQIFLRAMLQGGSLVLSSPHESVGDFLIRLGIRGTTHISGTPSHWRRALMSTSTSAIAPRYVRLSGEIADQPILDRLRETYPGARVIHAFASTEAGVAFDVPDGLAGFPASLLGRQGPVEIKVLDESLRIRSARRAIRYLGNGLPPISDAQGFVDTGDLLELHRDRYYFVGRRDGVINVGGLKVHPEEVETVINSHLSVQMSRVKGQKNAFMGAIVAADVVPKAELIRENADHIMEGLKSEIVELCHQSLAPHKIPAVIRFVPSLNIMPSGKLARVSG